MGTREMSVLIGSLVTSIRVVDDPQISTLVYILYSMRACCYCLLDCVLKVNTFEVTGPHKEIVPGKKHFRTHAYF